MASREELRNDLRKLIKSKNTYFQPPASIRMNYPCFIYSFEGFDRTNADNKIYRLINKYQLTYVSREPDMEFVEEVIKHFPMCSLSRSPFVTDNLWHAVFTLYY